MYDLDLVLLQQMADAARQGRYDLLAAVADGTEIDLGIAHGDAEIGGLADLARHVGDAQHGLRRNAGVVEAAAADDALTTVSMPSWAARIAVT